ncbi:arsenate reductase ArsC [Pelagibius litoralis]|uniref:Arsenate reductase ArsC n=1 Tax=Pelagibius litoralis TaxID=374515 RepID=A0A967F044_9PROT|nr:arsenate reductase ArsC [Pelagibius litoralis]NIA70668.1 arsenate reductase ArsC [Pelagibius litoralis]
MTDRVYNVLILCTGNSARSIMAESILNRVGAGRFKAYSAGSHPAGRVHPYAIDLLKSLNHPVDHLASKSWDVFAGEGAPRMDFVFTVCDNAAGEACPLWPGAPMRAHWPFRDPAAAEGSEAQKRQVFADVYGQIHKRAEIFVNLPMSALDKLSLQKRLDEMAASFSESA